MKTILLSFDAETFEELEKGNKKFEYRKNLPEGEFLVYFYVSNPVKAITGIGYFGQREHLSTWIDKYANRPQSVQERIREYLTDCRYVAPMYRFQKTNRISLNKLREDMPSFIVPRMYYYIEGTELLSYLEKELIPEGEMLTHSFENIEDDDIC